MMTMSKSSPYSFWSTVKSRQVIAGLRRARAATRLFAFLFSAALLGMASSASAMTEMHDDELSAVTGRALMQMGKEVGTGISSGLMFYKAGLDVELELNMNIERLQLGCTETALNGQHCDIDIRNLAISGAPESTNPDGTGNWANGRAGSSAILTRPFFEFAIKNDQSRTLREVVGIRMSGEQMTGLLTAGTQNHAAPVDDDGIQSLSGFMRIAQTTGHVNTQQALFGKQLDERIRGHVRVNVFLGHENRRFTSLPFDADSTGITIPGMQAGFSMPDFQVNGRRQTMASVTGVRTSIGSIPLSVAGCQAAGGVNCVGQLRVRLQDENSTNPDAPENCILSACSTKVLLANGSQIQNLHLDVTFNQDLSMIHNVPLTGTGMYLSFQKEAVFWPGAYAGADGTDIAQPGWWMSFHDQVDLGYLQGVNPVDISSVFPQVAVLASNQLLAQDPIYINLGQAIEALFDATLTTNAPVVVNLDNATNPALGGTPASITLENLQLLNQSVSPNCWGSARFC